MSRIDKTVIKETKYVASVSVILSLLTQSIFLIIGKWDYTVLLGNILSLAAGISNFLIMGITVQKAVLKEEAEAVKTVRLSQTLRLWGLFAVALVGALIPSAFNLFTVLIPLLFPSVAVYLRKLILKKGGDGKQ